MENYGSGNPDGLRGPETAGRHASSADSRRAPAKPARSSGRRWLGRMLTTPTFAAGIGIIVAAALAYGTTQTHLVFSGGEPACASAACTSSTAHGDAGQPLGQSDHGNSGSSGGSSSAGPNSNGRQAADSAGTNSAGRPAGANQGQPRGSQHSGQSSSSGGNHAPVIAYKTLRHWHGGFEAAITLSNRSKVTVSGWQLWLRYKTSQINHVWHAVWYPANSRAPASGLIVPQRGEQQLKPGAVYRFEFQAKGPPSPPIGCLFNGYHCTFSH